MVFSQLFPFVAITRFWGVCFRSQRLRLARLMGEFSDGFLTVVAATSLTRPIFCTNPSERVYITAWGCEIGSGRSTGLQASGAGGL